ncbi:MAG: LysR family transcriptional regulator [Alphaproteobacteria bacterium]|nr:LysR family transcriptional regulator [Alphaproteobacteria bacterium]NDA18650.1 LysR family transcriptional regulator [Alphaproteobacteria bacterium]
MISRIFRRGRPFLTATKKIRHVAKEPGVRTKLFIADETIGVGKINLLALVGDVGSISAAARQMGMSYRRAWFLLDSMQSGFRDPLFVTERGGANRGGAKLTPLGEELIRRYRAHVALVDNQSADILAWMTAVQVSHNDD